MLTISILVVLDINYVAQSKSEVFEASDIAPRNVLTGETIDIMYPMNTLDMESELIREMCLNNNVDNDLMININKISEKGLIDMSTTTFIKHTNGVEDSKVYRKILISEK